MSFLGSFFRSALRGSSAASTDSEDGPSSSVPAAAGKPRRPVRGAKPEPKKDVAVTHPSAALTRMMDGFEWADAEIVVGAEEKVFKVHSIVVATASPYMMRHFYGSPTGTLRSTRLALPATDPATFAALLRFCYSDNWGGNATLVLRLRRAARLLEMADLEADLRRCVEEDLSPSDAVGVMQAAAEDGDAALEAAALEAALADPAAAIASPSVPHLAAASLASLVSRDDFSAPELDIIQACLRWGAARAGVPEPSPAQPPQVTEGLEDDADDDAKPDDDAAASASGAAAAAASAALAASAVRARVPALTPEQGAAVRAALNPDIFPALRFPLVAAVDTARLLKPWAVLTPAELVGLISFQFQPRSARTAATAVAGFSCLKRAGACRSVLIHLWGGGGASGQDASCGGGGAGGYLCVRHDAEPDEVLSVYVGDGGYADAAGGTSSFSTLAWPNGGRGGYSWNSGGGGGATFVKSSCHGGMVIAGAGGGGGGTAARSWACGGGGGGGTMAGKEGSGGDCGNQPVPGGCAGAHGSGDGGKAEPGGSGAKGKAANGAGGTSGASTKANGGNGGDASFLPELTLVRRVNARDEKAIGLVVAGKKRTAGGGGRPGAVKDRGKPGMCIIEDERTGETLKVFSFAAPKAGKGKGKGSVQELRIGE